MSQFTLEGTFTLVTCANCAMSFGIPGDFETRRRKDHTSFYCPMGHANYYAAKSEAETLRESLAAEERNVQFWRERSESKARELVSATHRLRSTKGVVTKIKRRVAHGVCPCCQRTFRDLGRHMAGQHPDFADRSLRFAGRPQAPGARGS